jgi:hypothetical protein
MPYPKVIQPRRFKADAADSAIASLVLLLPLLTIPAIGDRLPPVLHPLALAGVPASLLYIVFRDSLGLRVIDLRTGRPCPGRRVWARNLLHPIPVLDVVDFLLMCVDRRGQKLMDKLLGTQVVET